MKSFIAALIVNLLGLLANGALAIWFDLNGEQFLAGLHLGFALVSFTVLFFMSLDD